jgi:branched-chain amino acid transport system permease protein
VRALRAEAPALVLLGLLAVLPFLGLGEGWALTLLARAMILAMAAVALSLLVGGAGLVSLGHAAMMGFGAYAVVILDDARIVEAWIVLPAAIAAAALFALLTGAVAIRTSGVHFIMITLAFGQMAFFTATSLAGYGGDDGYTLYSRTEVFGTRLLEDRLAFHYVCLGALAATWILCRAVLASRFGRVLRAAKGNPMRAQAVGFDPYPTGWWPTSSPARSAARRAFLFANATEFVAPATCPGSARGAAVHGDPGRAGGLHGAILGALAFVLIEEWLSHVWEHWRICSAPPGAAGALRAAGLSGLPGQLARGLRRPARPKVAEAGMAEPILRLLNLTKKFGGLR